MMSEHGEVDSELCLNSRCVAQDLAASILFFIVQHLRLITSDYPEATADKFMK